MNIEQERTEFEAWYRLHHGSLDVYGRDASGEYVDKQVQGAFNVWQARAALTAQAPLKESTTNWIRTSDRKPTADDADESGTVWVYDRVFTDVSSVHFYQAYSPYYTHWMPKEKRSAPPAPKGERAMTDRQEEWVLVPKKPTLEMSRAVREEMRFCDPVGIYQKMLAVAPTHPAITHCDNCGCDWLDNGLNPVGCPYCKLSAEIEALRAEASIARRALLWLTGGDSGMSSKAICCHMLGMPSDGSYPLDPSDLGRCLRLLELFPAWRPRMGEMARYSAEWAALVERWDELAEMMADEVGIDWSKGNLAPRTYAAMKDAMLKARGTAGQEVGNG